MKRIFPPPLGTCLLLLGVILIVACTPTPAPPSQSGPSAISSPTPLPVSDSCTVSAGTWTLCSFVDESGAPFLISVQDQAQTLTLKQTSAKPTSPVPTPDPNKKLNLTPIRLLFSFVATSDGKPVTDFKPALVIIAKYNSDDLKQAGDKPLKLFQFDREKNTWTVLPTTINRDSQTLTAPLDSLLGKDPEGTGY